MRNELRRRELGIKTPNRYEKYVGDAAGFVTEICGETIWSKQREVCQALVDYDRVAVKSCHESGKSFTAGRIVPWWIACHPPGEAFAVTSAPTAPQVEAVLWREINRVHARAALPGYTTINGWRIGRELVAFGRKPSDDAPAAFQGLHALHMLVVFDEAGGMPGSLWNAAETLVANEGGKILAIGNPDDPNTEFEKVCRPGSGYHVITISAFSTPNFTGEDVPEDVRRRLVSVRWVEERKKRWGEHSPLYRSKVLGEFPEVSDDALISPSQVQAAVDRYAEAKATNSLPTGGPNELGVDVGRSEGGNESVVYHRKGQVFRLGWVGRTRDTMEVVGNVVRIVRETGATRVKVDDPGVGGGVADRLNELVREGELPGVEIVPVNTGLPARVTVATQTDDDYARFANLKAELNWAVRDAFVSGEIWLEPEDDVVQSQITQIKYFQTSRGLVRMETKDELARRLMKLEGDSAGDSRSPDRWDALVLAAADVGVRPGVWDVEDLAA